MGPTPIGLPLLASIVVALVVAPGAGAAPYPRPLVRPDSERPPLIRVAGGRIALTQAAVRRYPRGVLRLSCADVPDDQGRRSTRTATVRGSVRSRPRLRVADRDFCVAVLRVLDRRGRETGRYPAGTVAVTPDGDDYLYEVGMANLMRLASAFVLEEANADAAPVASVARSLTGERVRGRRVVVAAATAPRTDVPVDRVGIWFDGTRTSVTATTPSGRRLVLEQDRATGATTSNVDRALGDRVFPETATLH